MLGTNSTNMLNGNGMVGGHEYQYYAKFPWDIALFEDVALLANLHFCCTGMSAGIKKPEEKSRKLV